MSPPGATRTASGMFGPVTGPDGRAIDPRTVVQKEGGGREKRLVDEGELPEEYADALDTDHFVIYGRASVEQYDEDGQRVDVEALEESLGQLFDSGNISRRHKDVRVGEPLPEWELGESRDLTIGDEDFSFDEGDTLETGVNPDVVERSRSGQRDEDEFWICADVWSDTEIARDTRLRVLSGDLTGFSVTIYAKETQPTSKGEDVTELDWHAVTIGSDEAIKNKESRFGLAEFKALLGADDPAPAGGRDSSGTARSRASPFVGGQSMLGNLLRKAGGRAGLDGELLEAASAAAEKAQNDDVGLKEAAEAATPEGASFKSEDVENAVSVLQADAKASDDDLEEILVGVEAGDLSAEEALEMIDVGGGADDGGNDPDEALEETDDMATKEEEEGPPEAPDDDEEEQDDGFPEEKLEELVDGKLDDKLDEKLEDALEERGVATKADLEEQKEAVVDTVASKLDEGLPDADDIAEKMETGTTASPSGGSGAAQRDYHEEMRAALGADGGDSA